MIAALRHSRHTGLPWLVGIGGLIFAIQALISRYLFWDSYFALVAGRYIAASGIPQSEVLTSAGKAEWVDQQWLAHWLFYQAWAIGGYAGTALLSAAGVTLAYVLLAALLIDRGVPGARAMLWTVAAFFVALGGTVVRSQSLAVPIAVLAGWIIVRDSRRPGFNRWFLLVVPLLVVWANLHGSVLLGAGLTAAYALARAAVFAARRAPRPALGYGGSAALAVAAVFATPYGFAVLDYYGSLLANSAVQRYILEWTPPRIDSQYSVAFFAMLAITIAMAVYATWRRYRPPLVLVTATLLLGGLALTAVRHGVWFGLAAAVLNADIALHTRPRPPDLSPRFVRAVAALLLAIGLGGGALLVATPRSEFERDLPLAAMDAVALHGAGDGSVAILADELASALLWRHPALAGRVGFDTRLEQYPADKLERWFEFLNMTPPGWPAAADGYDIILVSARERPALVAALAADPGWSTLASEANGAAFVRVHLAGAQALGVAFRSSSSRTAASSSGR